HPDCKSRQLCESREGASRNEWNCGAGQRGRARPCECRGRPLRLLQRSADGRCFGGNNEARESQRDSSIVARCCDQHRAWFEVRGVQNKVPPGPASGGRFLPSEQSHCGSRRRQRRPGRHQWQDTCLNWRFVSANGCPFKRLQPDESRGVIKVNTLLRGVYTLAISLILAQAASAQTVLNFVKATINDRLNAGFAVTNPSSNYADLQFTLYG